MVPFVAEDSQHHTPPCEIYWPGRPGIRDLYTLLVARAWKCVTDTLLRIITQHVVLGPSRLTSFTLSPQIEQILPWGLRAGTSLQAVFRFSG